LTDIPSFKWVPNKATCSKERLMDEEAMKVALTAYTYNVFPETMADMVLKAVAPTGDFTDLLRDGLEIAVANKYLDNPGPAGTRVSYLLYLRNQKQFVFQENDVMGISKKMQIAANNLPKIHGVPIKYDVYQQAAHPQKVQWRIEASGIERMDYKANNIHDYIKYGYESGPCIMLNTQKLVKAKDPESNWMKVSHLLEVHPRRSREQDGLIMFPIKYFVDPQQVQVEHKDGQIVFTVPGFTRRKLPHKQASLSNGSTTPGGSQKT